MREGLNAAEQFVFDLCKKSFLRLWTYANPRGKDGGKELCDALVLCSPDVIIFSVKDIDFKGGPQPEVAWSRWVKRAVKNSTKQIYGAERRIRSAPHVVRSDGSAGLALPKPPDLRVHRVAVAAGSRGKVRMPFGDFGKGFVHVFDEISAETLLSELDTVTDFTEYLTAKERFCNKVTHMLQVREEDLLAIYLQSGRKFPDRSPNVLSVDDELWDAFMKRPEVAAKMEADVVSYVWDRLIDAFADDILGGNLEPGASPTNAEQALRYMARENRFSRRLLGEAFKEFVTESATYPLARMLRAPSGIVYVFLASPRRAEREIRKMELQQRCFVARGRHPESNTAVGIATEQYNPEGYSMDIAVHYQAEWRDEDQEMLEQIQAERGYFVSPRLTEQSCDEYPGADRGSPDSDCSSKRSAGEHS